MQAVNPFDLAHAATQVGQHWERLTGKRLFITGGTGFVGKWLLGTLVHANRERALRCEVVVLSRDPELFKRSCPDLAHAPGVELLHGDVRSFKFPATHFDMIIHGATDIAVSGAPLEVLDTCINGTHRVLELAAHSCAKDFLLLSSGAVYGRQPPELQALPETWNGAPDPLALGAAYGTGKRTAECLAIQSGRAQGMRVKIARCFAFVGPYLPMDKHFAIGNFIRDALQGQAITIHGDGAPLRSYLYAADLAAWLWSILLRGRDGEAYNVGGNEVVSIAGLAHAVNTALHTEVEVVCKTSMLPNCTPERYVPDLSKAWVEFGLRPCIDLQDSIQRTARWFHPEVGV